MTRRENAVALLRMIDYARTEAVLLDLPTVAAPLRTATLELANALGADATVVLVLPGDIAED